jgi:hypothetical protein
VASGAVSAQQYSGRRLMQRRFEYPQLLSDALVDHSIMKKAPGTGGYGKEGIPGVEVATCQAMYVQEFEPPSRIAHDVPV